MQPVLVTTNNRGVYFGYLSVNGAPDFVVLKDARYAVSWEEMRGYLDLANGGPNGGCRVTPSTVALTLYGIAALAHCTPEAAAAWEAEPWAE